MDRAKFGGSTEPLPGERKRALAHRARGDSLRQAIHAKVSLSCCLVVLCWVVLGCGAAKPQLVDLRQEAVRLNDEGYQYYRESRWRLAQNKFNEALKLNRLIDCRSGIASNLNNLGAIAQEQGNLADAEKYYRDALTIQQVNGDGAGICEALNNLGTVLAARGRWPEAASLYQQALGYANSLRPGPLLALTLMHQGDVARHQKNYQQALNLYQQALAIDTKRKDREGQAVRWGRLGRTYLEMSSYAEARRYLEMSLQEFRRLQRTNGIVDALDSLVKLCVAQGDRPGAQLYGERLLKIYLARKQTSEAERLQALLQKPVR